MLGADRRNDSVLDYRRRALSIIFSAIILIIAARIFYLQVIKHGYYSRLAFSNRIQRERIVAPRGLIRARDGSKLVVNVPIYQISILPNRIRWKEGLLDNACRWLKLDREKILASLEQWLEKYPDGREMTIVNAANKEQISVLEENSELLPFFRLVMKPRRQYPSGSLAAHVLGYVGEVTDRELEESVGLHVGDIIGRTGIEAEYEKYLRGIDGVRIVEISAEGTRIGEIEVLMEGEGIEGLGGSRPPVPGYDLYLALDLELQRAVERAFEWERGSFVAIDPRNGEILAALSRPAYDPNIFIEGVSEEKWRELYEDPANPLFNRIVQAEYPPGSIFKVVTAYAAVDNKVISTRSYLTPCVGSYRFGNRSFGCWKPEGHGPLTLYGAVVRSCDVFFYQLGERLSVDQFAAAGRVCGLGGKTGVDLPSEATGLLPDHAFFDRRFGKRKWTRGHLLNYSIGQGEILATAVQICRMAAVFANGGSMIHPHIVRKIADSDGRIVYENKREAVIIPGIDARVLRFIRRSMEGVVSEEFGTGRFAAIPGVRIAGKTGTAQNPHGEDHALFIAYAPADDPEIVLTIIMENAGHGGVMAAPVAREVLSSYFLSVARSDPAGEGIR